MTDTSRDGPPQPPPAPADPATPSVQAMPRPGPAPGPISVSLGGAAPAQATGAARPRAGGGTEAALLALRREVQALREAVAATAPASNTEGGGPDPVTERLETLTRSVQTLETYVSIGFFDRVRATLGEAATELRPVALERRVGRLRGLVRWLLLVQLVTLGLLVALNAPDVVALARTAWAGLAALLASAGIALPPLGGEDGGAL